jgi:hypothetical protein
MRVNEKSKTKIDFGMYIVGWSGGKLNERCARGKTKRVPERG